MIELMDTAKDWFMETLEAVGFFLIAMAFILAVFLLITGFFGAFAAGFAAIF